MDGSTRPVLAKTLGLETEPVALRWSVRVPRDIPKAARMLRFCQKLGEAMRGQSFYSTAEEEECMGGARYW